jgi:hypothetical protein
LIRLKYDTKEYKMKLKGYVLATVLGAIGGGVAVALATNAIPKLMQHMEVHMQNMMAQMKESGLDPSQMCPMMASLGKAGEEGVQGE